MAIYYIYVYLDSDNVPFYVGKGKKNRYKIYKHLDKYSFNRHLKSKIRKVGIANIKVHFLHENLTEEEAFQFEIFYIKLYGRRDLGTGTLCNLTDGGEGDSGCIVSKETRQKISAANKGRIRSEEIKRKLSEAHKGQVAWNTGTFMAKEQKKKISASCSGRKHTDETKQKMCRAKKGKTFSDVHKQKLSEAWVRRRQKGISVKND